MTKASASAPHLPAISLLLVFGVLLLSFALPRQVAADTTGALSPVGNGFYTDWTGDFTQVDEAPATPDCSSSELIFGNFNNGNNRDSYLLNLSSIPDGATITSVTVTVRDSGILIVDVGAVYRVLARLNGVDTEAASNFQVSQYADVCSVEKSQTLDVADTLKTVSTVLEIGVRNMESTVSSQQPSVGILYATVTYTPPAPSIPSICPGPAAGAGFDFTAPCAARDACYANAVKTESARGACDGTFFSAMTATCSAPPAPTVAAVFPPLPRDYFGCLTRATSYYFFAAFWGWWPFYFPPTPPSLPCATGVGVATGC